MDISISNYIIAIGSYIWEPFLFQLAHYTSQLRFLSFLKVEI